MTVLPEADAILAAVVRASLDCVIVADAEGVVLEFNEAAQETFGLTRAQALGRQIGALIVPQRHRAAHEAGMARMRAGGERRVVGRRVTMTALRADGTEFPCELAIQEIEAAGARLFCASLRDLSDLTAADAERRAAEALLRALVDDQTEVIFRYDADLRCVFCNEAASRLHGVPREALLGGHFLDGVDAELQPRVTAEIAALRPDSPVAHAVDPKRVADGTVRWLDWTNRALFDAQGRLTGYLSVGRDVTERRFAELALEEKRRENALFRRIFEAMPDFVYAKDRDGRFIAANDAVARTMGHAQADALLGLTDADCYPPDIAARYLQDERDFYASGEESRVILQPIWSPDGVERWQAAQKALFRDAEGRVIGLIGHSRDVTGEVLAQRALAASEARFAQFMRHAPVGMYLKDAAGRYVLANPEMEAVLDLPLDAILGRTINEIDVRGRFAGVAEIEAEVLRTGRPHRAERAQPGRERYEQSLVVRFPVESGGGGPVTIGGFQIDLTAMKRAEAESARARDALHQSEKMNAMGSLAAGVAHELNNPLAIVAAQAEMLAEDAAGGALAARADKIKRAADRCGRIVQTFLAMARRKPPQRRAVDLADVVDAALDLVSYGLRTAGVRVERAVDPATPCVEADPDQLHQVLVNLIVNAQQAMENRPGERILRLAVLPGADGRTAVVDVTDTGPGVPPEHRERIFEPFFTSKPEGAGTGVGLSFSRGVIEAHAGTLTLAEADRGATFRLTLPVGPTSPASAVSPIRAVAATGARILVVDDEPEIAGALREMLARAGHEVMTAPSGAAALGLLADNDVDLVMSDLRMPDLDGPALHARLAIDHPDLAARMVFVTGDALGPGAERFLSVVGLPVVAKPFSRAEVLGVVAAALAGRR